jgi:threonine dehydratase
VTTTEPAREVAFTDASRADMSFIAETIEQFRLDAEDLQPEQFITVWRPGRMVAFGRIKPYQHTYELGSVCVVEEERGKGLGAAIVRELIRRFPQDEVYITTDAAEGLPAYYEKLGFLRTQILPEELTAKIERVCRDLGRDAVGMMYDRCIERLPTIADVYRARHAIEPHLQRTPLIESPTLSREVGFEAHLKLEGLLPIGAFKVRGGVNLCSGLSDEERARGIIGASTGNHGQSLAYGARLCGTRCIIAMPEESNPMKVDSMRALGAEVEFHGANFEEARQWAEDYARSEGLRYVHHINAPELVAGVATMGLEVVEDLPNVDVIVTPIGGGSGALGHLIAAKALRPDVEVIGVQTAGAPAVYNSWRDHVIKSAPIETSAEGLATGQAYYVAVKTLIDRIDDMVLVTERELHDAVLTLLRTAHVVAEESGAAATAGALKLKDRLAGKKVAIIVSGGNMTLDNLRRILLQATPG